MKTSFLTLSAAAGFLTFLVVGAQGLEPQPGGDEKPKRVELGKNVIFEKDGDKRRVLVQTYVCLREGQLEQLLTRRQTKEHEAILAFDGDARSIHVALLAAGAKPGSTVKYEPKYTPPTGDKIRVTLQYEDKGKTVTIPAQKWIRTGKNKVDLEYDWVFAGSRFIKNPFEETKPDYFLANDGDIICVSNFEGALLDLPIVSSKDNNELLFEANTDRIPPKDTKVTMILEVIPAKK